MNKSLENFKKYLPLLQQFVKRDFKTKYRRSVLGILWSVLNPLGMMLVMTVVLYSGIVILISGSYSNL